MASSPREEESSEEAHNVETTAPQLGAPRPTRIAASPAASISERLASMFGRRRAPADALAGQSTAEGSRSPSPSDEGDVSGHEGDVTHHGSEVAQRPRTTTQWVVDDGDNDAPVVSQRRQTTVSVSNDELLLLERIRTKELYVVINDDARPAPPQDRRRGKDRATPSPSGEGGTPSPNHDARAIHGVSTVKKLPLSFSIGNGFGFGLNGQFAPRPAFGTPSHLGATGASAHTLASYLEEAKEADAREYTSQNLAAVTTFYDVKSRETRLANNQSELLRNLRTPATWPMFGSVTDGFDHSKGMPLFTRGGGAGTEAFDANLCGLLLETRQVTDKLCDLIGSDGRILRYHLNSVEQLAKLSTLEQDNALYDLIMNDERAEKTARVAEATANCIAAVKHSLSKHHPGFADSTLLTYARLSQEKQLRALIMRTRDLLTLRSWPMRGQLLSYMQYFVEKPRPFTPTMFQTWLIETEEAAVVLTDLGLCTVDLFNSGVTASIRHALQRMHGEQLQVVVLLVNDNRELVVGDSTLDVIQVLSAAAALERQMTASPVNAPRPGIRQHHPRGTALLVKNGTAPSPITGETWSTLSREERMALSKQDREKGFRLSFEMDKDGNRIHQVYCGAGPTGGRGCGWVNATDIKKHKATCEHHRGASREARRGRDSKPRGNVKGTFEGKCNNCHQQGHRARDCTEKPATTNEQLFKAATMLSTAVAALTGQPLSMPPTASVSVVVPNAMPAPAPTVPGKHALFSSATALSSMLNAHKKPAPGPYKALATSRRASSLCSCGHDADEDPGGEGDIISIDPLGLGTWGPSLPMRRDMDDFDVSGQTGAGGNITLPRHAWLHASLSADTDLVAVDAMRTLADLEQAGIVNSDFYAVGGKERIMSVAAHATAGACITVSTSDRDFEIARLAVGAPPFACRADMALFLEQYGAVLDSGANLHAVNSLKYLTDAYPCSFQVSTVGDPVAVSTAGTLAAQVLTKQGNIMVKMPDMHSVVNVGSEHSIISTGLLKKSCSNVDSCLDPTREQRAAGIEPWLMVDGEDILVLTFDDIQYVIMLPFDDSSADFKHTMAFTVGIESFASSLGAPDFDQILLQSSGADAPTLGAIPERPCDTLPMILCKGRGYTLQGESNGGLTDVSDDVEAGSRVDAMHRCLVDYLDADLASPGRAQYWSAQGRPSESLFFTTRSGAGDGTSNINRAADATTSQAAAPAPDSSEDTDNESDGLELLSLDDIDSDPEGDLIDRGHLESAVNDLTADAGEGHDFEEQHGDEHASHASPGKLRVTRIPLIRWHYIFGHASAITIRATLRARGFRAFDDDGTPSPFHCDTCAVSNIKKQHRGGRLGMQRDMTITAAGELVCIDVFHLADVESLTGTDKVLICVCKKTGFSIIAPYSLNKDGPSRYQLGGVITRVILEVRRLSKLATTISVHSDLALDQINFFTEEQLTALGAIHFGGAAYHSNTNPLAEVTIRILRAKARAFAIGGGLPPQFMYILLRQATEIQNDLVGDDGKSPRMRMTGESTPYSCPFDMIPGQLAFAFKAHNPGASKQAARGHVVIYLGRGSIVRQVGYMCYDPVGMRVFVTPSLRFPNTPFEETRFPYMEGLWIAAAKRARHELRISDVFVQPYDVELPNGMYAHEFMDRKVRARKTTGRGWDVGEVTTCRYENSGRGRDLMFGVKWRGEGAAREVWYNFEELVPLLVDDSGVELLINFALACPQEAEDLMFDATSYCTILHTASETVVKRHGKRTSGRKRGRINESTWTDIVFALRDAASVKEQELWKAALQKELNRLFYELEVFEWSAKREGDIGPMRLSLPCKKKMSGDLHSKEEVVYKVRCVGGTSKKEIERTFGLPDGGWESFAATIAQQQLLHFLAICTELGLHLFSLDVEGAYLNADAPRENLIYKPPDNFPPPDPSKPYLRAKRALYGWAESGRAWYVHFLDILKKLGFTPCDRNSTWMHRRAATGLIMLGTVVDDCAVGASSEAAWLAFLVEVRAHVPVDAGRFEMFIGVAADYQMDKGRLLLNQTHLIELAMKRFGINDDCRRTMTPMETNAKVSSNDSPQVVNPDDVLFMQSILGTLQYITITRPEIKMAINLLARVASNPSKGHMDMARRVLMYLAHTRHVPLVFSRGPWFTPDGLRVAQGQIIVYVDASFADSPIELKLKSRTGFIIMRAGATIQSKSGLQGTQSGSSCQAEVIALYTASIETQAALQDLIRLEMPHEGPVLVMEDNSAAISVMSAAGTSTGSNSRHFLVKYFYTAELCEDGTLKLVKVGTNDQLADGFTKPLPVSTHARHRHYIQGLHALSTEELRALGLDNYEPTSISE